MQIKRPWLYAFAGFVLGEALGYAKAGLPIVPVIIIFTGVLLIYFFLSKWSNSNCFFIFGKQTSVFCRICVTVLIFMILGMIRFHSASFLTDGGRKLQELETYKKTAQYSGKVDSMEIKDQNLVIISGNLMITVPITESYDSFGNLKKPVIDISDIPKLGNSIQITGKIIPAKAATNPGEFDYKLYLKGRGITHTCYALSCKITDSHTDVFRQFLFSTRQKCIGVIDYFCEEKDAGFLKAVLLGDKSGMDEDMYDLYRENGIAHLLAISGLHIALLGMGMFGLLRKKFGIAVSCSLSSFILICYALLLGVNTGVIRAVIMLLLVFIATGLGRSADMLNSVSLAGICILAFSPYLLFSCGFQLSFLAVTAIAGPAKFIIKEFKIKNSILQSLIVSICVTLVSLPCILFWFFAVSLYGFILNILVIPLMPYVIISGAALLGFSWIRPLSLCAAGSVNAIVRFYTFICEIFSGLPESFILTGRPGTAQIVLYYLLLIALFVLIKRLYVSDENRDKSQIPKRKKSDIKRFLPVAALFISMILCVRHIKDNTTAVYFLNVGQGDCICVIEGNNCTIIDSGSSSDQNMGKKILKPFLQSLAIERIDRIFLTHPDSDHMNGLVYLLEEEDCFDIGEIVLTSVSLQDTSDKKYERIRTDAEKRDIKLTYMDCGQNLGKFTCISPEEGIHYADGNASSMVLLYERGEFAMLLTGDATSEAEEIIIKKAEKDGSLLKRLSGITVLKAGHHGSDSSTSENFLQLVNPQFTVLSYGKENRYGHPAEEVVERLTDIQSIILKTAEDGAIKIRTDGKRVELSETCTRSGE